MEDSSFEHLATRRLVIRRFTSVDAEALASYRSEAEVARYQDWVCPYPVSEAEKFIASLQHLAPGTPRAWFQFAVSLRPSPALIGDVALCAGPADAREAELGFTFAAAHQGHGYATEAVGAVVQYAFAELAMHRVFSRTESRNLRAQRLLERLGFRRESELPDFLYAQLESEWRPEHAE